MKLRNKLALAFILVTIIPLLVVSSLSTLQARRSLREAEGAHMGSLAHEKAAAIARIIQDRIFEARTLAIRGDVIEAVRQANAANAARDEEELDKELDRMDLLWIAQNKKGGSQKAKEILANPTSRALTTYQQRDPQRFGEIILTDRHGAAIGITKLLSDYVQSDEGWWQQCHAGGKGSVFLDDRGLDETVGALVMGVTVPVRGASGEVTGVLKINYKIKEILDVVADRQVDQHTITLLVRSLGSLVTHSGLPKDAKLTEQEQEVLFAVGNGFADNTRDGKRYILGYNPVKVDISARVPTPGERKGISGEKWEPSRWWLMVQVPHAVAFAPLDRLIRLTMLGALLALGCAIVLALMVSKSISRPLLKLHQGTEIIGKGDLEHRVGTSEKDEIGQLSRAFDDMLDRLAEVTASRDELDRARQELQRSNQELEQFAYVSSHDLQEPLRMVTSYTQLLAKRYEGQLDENADKYIAYAVDGATRMHQLIHDLLAYSRVSSQARSPEPVDCEAVLKRVLVDLNTTIQEAGAQVAHDPLPTVMADPGQLARLLQNLVGNAIKYNDSDRPTVHVSAEREERMWRLSVRDNGIGIEPEHAERIFEIFQRLHRDKRYPGTGIGLAVCKKIVEQHGGKIWVEPTDGQGALFCFTLPAVDDSTPPA